MNTRVTLIANPAAGRGQAAARIHAAAAIFAAHGVTELRLTSAPGDEARQVRAALDAGADTLVVIGGDGTWSKSAAELARLGAPARLALLAAGTGNDFARNLTTPARDPAALARLVTGPNSEHRVDMGAVDDELFLNVAGFAFDVAVLTRVEHSHGTGGAAAYALAALRELLGYRGLRVAVDDRPARKLLLLAFGNGAHFGGVFHVAPGARVDDGLLDAIEVADVRRRSRPALLARAAMGRHLTHAAVAARRAAGFTLHFDAPPAYEADGELRQARAPVVRVECRPGVLRMVGPAAQPFQHPSTRANFPA